MQETQSSFKLIISTAYLPPVAYLAWLSVADEIHIEINETYPKQTWRNRCTIASANGPLNLVIPVEKPLGNRTPTRLVEVSSHKDWQKQHWKSIVSSYRKSAFFTHYGDILEPFFAKKFVETLIDWNDMLLNAICRELGFKIQPMPTQSFERNPEGYLDLRFSLSPKKLQKASTETTFIPYFQGFSEKYGFLPNLSIIDVLFNMGPNTTAYLRQCGKNLLAQKFSISDELLS
ncbi:MAG TPA: WbqC family protein [Bacteroidales bacterium]|nr:WbqC family protein [Bacteroidales bacterium]